MEPKEQPTNDPSAAGIYFATDSITKERVCVAVRGDGSHVNRLVAWSFDGSYAPLRFYSNYVKAIDPLAEKAP